MTLLLAGANCSSSTSEQGEGSATHAQTTAPESATTTRTGTKDQTDRSEAPAAESAAVRCTGDPGPGHDLRVPVGRSELVAAELGHGTTWAVLLHQTDGDGLCGWWPYANWLAVQGVHVLAIDLCGYGRSTCPAAVTADQSGQAVAALNWARRHGAHRVTLVGASMGGAVSLPAASEGRADAVVDLSGPPDWPGTDLQQDVRRLTMPTLLSVSPTDPTFIPAYRRALAEIPAAHKRLVVYEGGHGYQMLGYRDNWSRLGELVRDWITGEKTG